MSQQKRKQIGTPISTQTSIIDFAAGKKIIRNKHRKGLP